MLQILAPAELPAYKVRMKNWWICLVMGCMTVSTVWAAGDEAYCSKPIRVAMFEFGLLYRSSTGDGVDSRLLDVLAKRSGCTFERVLMPRARIWTELQGGTLDMATAAVPTAERRAYGYLLPYLITRNQLLLRKDSGSLPTTMAAFEKSGLHVGVVRSFKHEPAYDAFFDRMAAKGLVHEAADVAELFRFLERGMVQAVLSQPIVFPQYVTSEQIRDTLVFRDWAPKDEFLVGNLILSRKSFTPQQAARWDGLVSQLLRDGAFQSILQAFMSANQARGVVYHGPRTLD